MTSLRTDPLLEAYVLRVGAALGDVEPTERHALLADLRLHLDEVGRDDDRRLDDIVGPPEVYASELRAAAGLAADAPAAPPADAPAPVGEAWPWARDRIAAAAGAVAAGWRDVRGALGTALADGPTWWLLRAYLAVHVLGALTGSRGAVLLPHVLHERLWGLVALFVAAVASIRIGRDPGRVPPGLVRAASAVVVVVGVWSLVHADMYHG